MSGGESLSGLFMHKQAAIMTGIDNVDISSPQVKNLALQDGFQ